MEVLNDNDIVMTDDNGKEYLMKILFTYENEERGTKYVYVYEEANPDDIFVFKYNEEETDLLVVDDEEELEEAQEVLEAYDSDPKIQDIK